MKKSRIIIATIIMMLLLSTGQAQEFDRTSDLSSENQISAVFASRVNLRESPNVKTKVLTKLELGALVEVIEKTNIPMTLEGRTEYWYKVKTGYYTGYLWGGLLAKYVVKSERNPDVLFMLQTTNIDMELRVKVVRNNRLLQDKIIDGLAPDEQLYGFYAAGQKGISGIQELIAINYIGEFCGATSGQTYLAWDGSELNKFMDVGSEGDGGYYSSDWVVFPSDILGEKNLIHFYHEEEEYMEGESGEEQIISQEKNHIVYRWDGSKLVVVK